MELDAIQHGRRGDKEKKPYKKNTIKCYACGKLGHMARNCKSKNKVQCQQLNALKENWNIIEQGEGSPKTPETYEE